MALSGLDIYKLLPKTNCKECGFATCLAFAMQLAKKAVSLDACPYVSEESKRLLLEASRPPMRLVTFGSAGSQCAIGGETVMFRHEEKFRNPCGIGVIVDDDLSDGEMLKKVRSVEQFDFERVGEKLPVQLIAVRQKKDARRFSEVVSRLLKETTRALVLMSEDAQALSAALEAAAVIRPILYRITPQNSQRLFAVAKKYKVPVVLGAASLEELAGLCAEARKQGIEDIILQPAAAGLSGKLWEFTAIRRAALKRSYADFGFPAIAVVERDDPYEEAMEAATFIAKYAGIVLVKSVAPARIFSLLTLRQNIYTDPQKPLQVVPEIYAVGAVTDKSPLLITTNFSLSYYTVLGEAEASKVPVYILSVDTEGMSVLTAWAAEKFTPERIADSLSRFNAGQKVAHKTLVLPGYVAVLSGDLEEASGWTVLVGPKEAAGLPSFLKNM